MKNNNPIIKNLVEIVHQDMLHKILLSWAAIRYRLSDIDFAFEPVITSVSVEFDLETGINLASKRERDYGNFIDVFMDKDIWEDNLFVMATFPSLTVIKGIPQMCFTHLVVGQNGVICCYFISKDGCEHLHSVISQISNSFLNLESTEDEEDAIGRALNIYIKEEKPVEHQEDCDKGYISVKKDQEFRIYMSAESHSFITLEDLDKKIRKHNNYPESYSHLDTIADFLFKQADMEFDGFENDDFPFEAMSTEEDPVQEGFDDEWI